MARSEYLFTSESVSEGHPDKVCDRISDEIVDLFFKEAKKASMDPSLVRVACETLATTNRIVIAGEVLCSLSDKAMRSKVKSAARKAVKSIYARTAAYGHFGLAAGCDGAFSWARTDLAGKLKAAVAS